MRSKLLIIFVLSVVLMSLTSSSCHRKAKTSDGEKIAETRQGRLPRRIRTATEAEARRVRVSTASVSESERDVLSGPEIFERYNSAVFLVLTDVAQGSGFFVSSAGVAVSNFHVFADADRVAVKTTDGRKHGVRRILAYDEKEDYIVFEVGDDAAARFNYVPISNRAPRVGEKAYAIGSPRGYENTFSSGEISQLRSGQYGIQISVPIDHGSSGGVLLNEYGEAIGITSAGLDESGANLNFAIDIHVLQEHLSLVR